MPWAGQQVGEGLVLRVPVLESVYERIENLTPSRCAADAADNMIRDRQQDAYNSGQ